MRGGSASPHTTIYYLPYKGNLIPIDVSGNLQYVSFTQTNPLGLTHVLDPTAADTNYVLAGNVYDEFVGLNAGAPTLCNGPGWSNSFPFVRITGLEVFSGVLVNAAQITCNFGAGSTFVCPQDQCTYVGSFYATPGSTNGLVSFNPQPTAAPGGASAVVGFWNYYNRVPITIAEQDSETPYGVTGTAWEVADAQFPGGSFNNITVIDGYQETPFNLLLTQNVTDASPGYGPSLSINLAHSCATGTPATYAIQKSTSAATIAYTKSNLPLLGLQCAQAIEQAGNTTPVFYNPGSTGVHSALTLQLSWEY